MATQVEPKIWEVQGQEKREAVQRMFGEIAPRYDLLNSLISLRLHRRWRSYAVSKLELGPGQRTLDVCCGTGDFMMALQRAVGPSGVVVGLDFCCEMLALAQQKTHGSLGMGDACRLPVRSDCVDAVTVGWGIRNVPDIDAAHEEISRVLKPGGRFASIDMAMPKNPVLRWASTFLFHSLVPRLGSLFGKSEAYTYLPQSAARFWTREQLANSMARAGFTEVHFEDLFFGNICVHFGRKPLSQ